MIQLFALIFTLNSVAYAEPHYFAGENVEICEQPSNITHIPHIRGSPYFLNYGKAWPQSYLTIVIWERDISALEINPYSYFQGDQFCMKGRVTTHNSIPQIIIRDHSQLTRKVSN